MSLLNRIKLQRNVHQETLFSLSLIAPRQKQKKEKKAKKNFFSISFALRVQFFCVVSSSSSVLLLLKKYILRDSE